MIMKVWVLSRAVEVDWEGFVVNSGKIVGIYSSPEKAKSAMSTILLDVSKRPYSYLYDIECIEVDDYT